MPVIGDARELYEVKAFSAQAAKVESEVAAKAELSAAIVASRLMQNITETRNYVAPDRNGRLTRPIDDMIQEARGHGGAGRARLRARARLRGGC